MRLAYPFGIVEEGPVSGKWFKYGVGIDCHKAMVWTCILQPDYKANVQQRAKAKFATDSEDLARMRQWLETVVPLGERRYLLESTSTYHFPVIHALPGWTPTVINPKLVGSSKRKTDRWDCEMLAHHSMAGTFPSYVLPTMEEYGWRSLYRRSIKIDRSINRNIQAMVTRMTLFGVNYVDATKTVRGWAALRSILLGEAPSVGGLSPDAIAGLDALVANLGRVPRCVTFANKLQIDEVEFLQKEKAALWSKLLEAVDQRSLRLLLSVPHISQRTALAFLCEVGRNPRRRFPSMRSIVAYSGFDPSKRVSADQVTSYIPTSGNRFIRRAFLQAASGVMLAKSTLGDYGRSISARYGKKGWFAGVNSIGRRLIKYAASVLIAHEPFVKGLCHGEKEIGGDDPFGEGNSFPGINSGFTLDFVRESDQAVGNVWPEGWPGLVNEASLDFRLSGSCSESDPGGEGDGLPGEGGVGDDSVLCRNEWPAP